MTAYLFNFIRFTYVSPGQYYMAVQGTAIIVVPRSYQHLEILVIVTNNCINNLPELTY